MQWVRGWGRGCGNLSMTIMGLHPPAFHHSSNTRTRRNYKMRKHFRWIIDAVETCSLGPWRWGLLNNLIFLLFSSHKFAKAGHPNDDRKRLTRWAKNEHWRLQAVLMLNSRRKKNFQHSHKPALLIFSTGLWPHKLSACWKNEEGGAERL